MNFFLSATFRLPKRKGATCGCDRCCIVVTLQDDNDDDNDDDEGVG